jgi:hypothetical protein
MDTNSQTRAGRPIGAPNYKNDILIEVVELYLPQGLEAWRAVALAYQRESMETVLRRGEDLRDNWNKKLCKNPIWRKRPRPPPASPVHCVTGRNHNIEQAVKCLSRQSSDVKEGRRVTLVI